MNKFKKLKQSTKFSFNEDSSDYISDAEGSLTANTKQASRLDNDSLHEGNSNSQLGHLAEDYSNDSFGERERDSFSGGFSAAGKLPKGGSQLNECLEYLHRMVHRKDKEGIFEFPVTDLIAPGYSTIIKNPMDLSSMKSKIDSSEYSNVMEYRDDLILMCDNCMTYNKPDTIYYQFAKKMRDYGFKLLSREKLLTLRATVRCMRFLTAEELGFSLEASDIYYDTNAIRKKQTENKMAVFKTDISLNLAYAHAADTTDSRLMAPEGDDEELSADDEESREARARLVHEEVKELARLAAERLARKNPNGKMGFLRRNSNGTLGYHIIQNTGSREDEEADEDGEKAEVGMAEKAVTIGNLMEGLQASSYSMASYVEEKKDKSSAISYIESGPFSSQAPTEDTTFSQLPAEDLNMLRSAYGDEVGAQYALSLMEYCKETGDDFKTYVKTLLNELSCNEHEKYLKYLSRKQTGQIQADPIQPQPAAVKQVGSPPTIAK